MFRGSIVALRVMLVAALILLSSVSFCATASASEHPGSIVNANIYVSKTKILMRLQCFAEDLELLHGVEPYEDGKYDNTELEEGTEDHAKYLLEKIVIMDVDGEPLKGEITEIKPIEIPQGGINSGDLMEYSMGFVIEYKLTSVPEFITIRQEMVADGALVPSELNILMKQAGSQTPYKHKMKPEAPETFRFDWENLPLNLDASEEDWNAWLEEQREKQLGITSYGSLYNFIYITKREVRQELLIPIASLGTFIDIERRDERFLEIDEQDALKCKIEALLSAANPVTVNGEKVKPTFDRIDFYGLDIRDFAIQAGRRKISMSNGRVGIIMSYFSGSAPNDATFSWDMFNAIVRSVDVIVLAFDDVSKTQFTKFLETNVYTWTNQQAEEEVSIRPVPAHFDLPFWANFPWLSLLLFAGAVYAFVTGRLKDSLERRYLIAGVLTSAAIALFPIVKFDLYTPWSQPLCVENEKADKIFSVLHGNLFKAFDYAEEGQIYDGLAKSVKGPLLSQFYLDLNDSLRIKEQGGAVAVITDVELLEGERCDTEKYFSSVEPGFVYRCKWNLVGNIEHWGHIHERTNTYDATFEVQAVDKQWKITQMRMNDAPRGVTKQRARKF